MLWELVNNKKKELQGLRWNWFQLWIRQKNVQTMVGKLCEIEGVMVRNNAREA